MTSIQVCVNLQIGEIFFFVITFLWRCADPTLLPCSLYSINKKLTKLFAIASKAQDREIPPSPTYTNLAYKKNSAHSSEHIPPHPHLHFFYRLTFFYHNMLLKEVWGGGWTMYRRTNLTIYRCTNVTMYRRINLSMHGRANVTMYRCTNVTTYAGFSLRKNYLDFWSPMFFNNVRSLLFNFFEILLLKKVRFFSRP
jgi:hypothetical protein